ncbi:site-specific DNA-methyltransferase [Campylobacter vulpis]|uniref:site-specific DNA-methyltransferase n=1 Tax=Campylobacter vulpis TaxID=1655500 RepID=UPI000C14F547|nr:site-specific DNA-methyltransferase [Campylobacter vulpis]MBS4275001.1 site-specific DNA-methyltransferase [Campylobacter vulpis]MBS4306158.1 site-specific DNA-methyltransferase [Campylobacter vulpis]MBS4329188.1 site-specific DNA-methyltransferase [Campylobacter vulpis]MBS4422724.1 site-specific DNA-methyltransferase [Campylobacter vulpis]PHY92048.1 restriction endonuclease [Campylobacter vulpis]
MSYQQAFFSKLKECYLGVRIEGERGLFKQSGFTNLLHIKQKYFENIRDYLEKEELGHLDYSKLYDFFSTYLNETGTPFFYETPIYKNIYARVYSNSKDVSLFYKTQNLYYVKSDTIYKPLTLKDEKESYSFHFLTDDFIQNADNNKNKIIFYLQSIEDNELNIKVINDKNLNLVKVFKQNSSEFSEDFLKALKKNEIIIKEEELKSIFKSYKKQNEIDFFIHKNAKAFLKEQFDLWFCRYVLDGVTQWNEVRIKSLNKVKKIAHTLIDKIAAFEDELKALWLKPKFAKKTHFVFSLNVIKTHAKESEELLKELFKDSNFKKQIKEWQDLKLVEESFKLEDIKNYAFLPLDTKHLSEKNVYKLLSAFENLDAVLNGELVKADNFQALNSLLPKYQNKVDLIYIDPPYNTGNDGFIYTDKFNQSSWLSMMNNRLELAKEFLKDKGSIFISIDDNEQARLKILCDEVFGEENFISNLVWQKKKGGSQDSQHFAKEHEYILCYQKQNWEINEQTQEYNEKDFNKIINGKKAKILKLEKWGNHSLRIDRPTLYYAIKDPNGNDFYPIAPNGADGCWRKKPENLDKEHIFWQEDTKGRLTPYEVVYFDEVLDKQKIIKTRTIFTEFGTTTDATKEIQAIFGDKLFDTPKPEKLLKRICEIASSEESIVLDFFAGSGTTLATAQKLGRKWLGVEMGEHFYKVILPRLKKVIGGFESGISKECGYKGGGAFSYYELESYEEALRECEYKLDENHIIDYKKSRKLIKTLQKGKNITLDMSGYEADFDPFLTLSNLYGWKIKKLYLDEKGVKTCEFENGEIVSLNTLDLIKLEKLKTLIWWE